MKSRRSFIKTATLGLLSIPVLSLPKNIFGFNQQKNSVNPVVLSTWNHGFAANDEAWKLIKLGKKAIDAVEAGVKIPESDPNVSSVGYGGLPDRDGIVSLDACIMDENGNCGAVAFLEGIKNPISVARLVMEKTPHIFLVGKGAQDFALTNGFKLENLLTEKAKERWEKWKIEANYETPINNENHDTIGLIALDTFGNLSGACTTSGLAWKMHGRVGDSPIIGAGLYVDNEVGAATATGKGEAIIKIVGSFLVVELMRQGKTPQEACEEAINRIVSKQKDAKTFQVGFLAINKKGETGAFAIHKGFSYAKHNFENQKMETSNFLFETQVRTY